MPRIGKCLSLLCLIGASVSCGSDRNDHAGAEAGSSGSGGANQGPPSGNMGGSSGIGGSGGNGNGSGGTLNGGQGGSGPTAAAHVQFVLKEVH